MSLSADDIAELTRLEEALWVGETRFRLDWMEGVLAADFFEFGRSGRVYSRAECLDIPAGEIVIELPLPDLAIRQLSDDIAQVTYKSVMRAGGKTLTALRSSIWQRTDDGWQLKFHQGTPT